MPFNLMALAKTLTACGMGALLSLPVVSVTNAIDQDRERRTRETPLGDGSILEALQPDDDIVEISWPLEEIAAFDRGNPSIAELQLSAKENPLIAAIVTVTAASGVLVQDNKWIHTRFLATVNEVIVTGSGVADRDRIARDQTIEFRARAGEVMIGRVTVRAGVVARYPVGRRYLVFLGQRQGDSVWTLHHRAPLIIEGDRLRAVRPGESRLSGSMVSDMTEALRSGRRVVLPRDQSDEDPEFSAWIKRLRAAAEQGDLAVIRDACAPAMRVYFEEVSREDALAKLVEGRPWLALRNALRLGVVRMDKYFVAPYLYREDEPRYGEVAITGRGVYMRSAPAPTASVVGVLSLDVLKLDESHYYSAERFEEEDHPAAPEAWAKVMAPNGTTGYVYGRYVRMELETRFIFERVDGQWKITAFAAGD